MTTDELSVKLRAACNGHPHAKIPWPHRLLHEAADGLESRDEQIERLRELLQGARCPDHQCDDEGTTVEQVCCGRGVPDGYGGQECCGQPDLAPVPCQWCEERDKALALTAPDADRQPPESGFICHAPGDRCLGCKAYRDGRGVCEYEDADGWWRSMPEVEFLVEAVWQVLDDMGEDGQCCCLAAKHDLSRAYEPFDDGDGSPPQAPPADTEGA